MTTRFRDLAVGQTFDFNRGADRADDASFFRRCRKEGSRAYSYTEHSPDGTTHDRLITQIGSISALVYHVEPAQEVQS